MAYPLNVKTRLVSFGGAATVEAGIPLHIRISTESSRSLIWVEDGYRLESLAALYMSAADGQEIVFEVPTTDQNGWLDAATRQAIIVDPGEASHLYTTKLEIFTEDHELIRTYEIGPYAVPEGPGVLDADLLNPNYDPIEGILTTYIPGPDGELSAAGQQAAADAIQAAIDAEGYRDEAEVFSATSVELQDSAVSALVATPESETRTQLNTTFGTWENVKAHGAVGDGTTDDSTAIQAAIDAVELAGGGTVFFPQGRYKASGLVAQGVLAFRGAGGVDLRSGIRKTDQTGSALTPAIPDAPIITITSSKRLIWRDLDFIHDRSFKADAMILGSPPGGGAGTFWPDLEVGFAGFDGHALKIIGVFWECDLRNVHARRCGDGLNDKAAIEIDGTLASSDQDTVRFSAPNVTFPRAVGFRLISSNGAGSLTGPGFRRLMLSGGMFHAGLDEDNVTGANRYDADMIVIDGFTSLDIRGVNVASTADGRWALKLDGSLTTHGSNRAQVEGNQFNGPVYVGKCKDVTIGRNDWPFWASPVSPEHVYITADAVRTVIGPQTVVNDGPFTVTDNSATTIRPSLETVLLPATIFTPSIGAPTLSRAASRFPAWLLDHSSTEQVNAEFVVPLGWRRFHVEMLWSNLGPGAGDVRWNLGYSARVVGDSLAAGDIFFPPSTEAAPSVDVLAVKTWTSTAITATQDAVYHFRLARLGDDVTDTLANDVSFIGLRLRRAA